MFATGSDNACVFVLSFVIAGRIEPLVARCDHPENLEACIPVPRGSLRDLHLNLYLAVINTQQVFSPVCASFKLPQPLPRTLQVVFGCLPFGQRVLDLVLHTFDVLSKLCHVHIVVYDVEQPPLRLYLSSALSKPRYILLGSHLRDSLHNAIDKFLKAQPVHRRIHWFPEVLKNMDLLNQIIEAIGLWKVASDFRGNFGDRSAHLIPSPDDFAGLVFVGPILPHVMDWRSLSITSFLIERECVVLLERLCLVGRPVDKSNVIENCGDCEGRQGRRILADWR